MGFRDLAGDLEVEPSRVLVCEGLGWGPEGGTAAGVPGCAVGCGLWAVGRTELHRSRESVHGRSQINGYNPLGMY